jgi:hypothetical protein
MVTDTCGASTYLQRLPKHFFRQTGIAVPGRLRAAWTYVRGSSRRRLPSLVTELEAIDIFIHDSMHTTHNLTFELKTV